MVIPVEILRLHTINMKASCSLMNSVELLIRSFGGSSPATIEQQIKIVKEIDFATQRRIRLCTNNQ
jgi:hypothetical protein